MFTRDFTTREQATCILLALVVLAVVVFCWRAVVPVLRSLASPKIVIPIALYSALLGLSVWGASWVGLWTVELTGATFLWYLASGLALFFGITKAGAGAGYLRRRIAEVVGVAAFFEFFNNLHAFGLGVELVLQPCLAFVVVLQAVAQQKDETAAVAPLLSGVLSIAGLALLATTAYYVIDDWSDLDKAASVRLLLLPMWLTVVALVGVYLGAAYVEYESAFVRMLCANDFEPAPLRIRVALAVKLRGRISMVHRFIGRWPRQLLEQDGFRSAVNTVAEFVAIEKALRRTVALVDST